MMGMLAAPERLFYDVCLSEHVPADAGQAVKSHLTTLDDAAFGATSDVKPKFISYADPTLALCASEDPPRI